jgi:hypothetical protein
VEKLWDCCSQAGYFLWITLAEGLLIVLGLGLCAIGLSLLARTTRQLRRSGVFGGVFWSSFRHYGEYRRRALRPAGGWLLGVLLLGGGLVAAYAGLAGFYAARLGQIKS